MSLQSLPADFIASLHPSLVDLPEALTSEPSSVGVRINPGKGVTMPHDVETVPWSDGRGFYLPERAPFTFDPALHQGLYYVQDPSSMAIAEVIRSLGLTSPVTYLDACAAPGGKTTAAIDSLPEGSLVVANEYVRDRAKILTENVIKWGYPGCVVTRGDTSRFRRLPHFFDIVAADVPCSGEGMMRKDATAVSQWSGALVEQCAARQKEIIANLWDALRPGGYFIYSTCTFNTVENEDMVRHIIDSYGGEPIDTALSGYKGITHAIDANFPAWRFIPGRTKGEGLFLAVLRKPGNDATNAISREKSPKESKIIRQFMPQINSMLTSPEDYIFSEEPTAGSIMAFPRSHVPSKAALARELDVIYAGTEVATVKGKDLIPAHSLPMSRALKRGYFPEVEVDYFTAISYLRREAIILPDATPRGFALLTYHNHPLGFVKNLGNRANNLYPSGWQILSSRIPEEIPKII